MIRAALTPVFLALATAVAVFLAHIPEPPPQRLLQAPAAVDERPAPARAALPVPILLPRGDPFRPFEEPPPNVPRASAPVGKLKVFGILIRGKVRVALINETAVTVGERIGDAVVRKIELNHVVLDRNGVEEVLEVDPTGRS